MSTDALVYANTINFLTNDSELSTLANKMQGVYKFSTGTTNLDSEATNTLNTVLSDTQIKRACCNGTGNINVRIPLPTGVTAANDAVGELIEQYNYYDKSIAVPITNPGFCTINGIDYSKNSVNCDDFYSVYCANMVNEFTTGNNNQFSDTEFDNYKAECACYIPTPAWLTQAWGGEPIPKCVFPGCSENTAAYLDPASRATECDYTICSQQINLSGVQQGQNSNIVNNIKAMCGQQNQNPFVGTETVPETAPSSGNVTGPIGGTTIPISETTPIGGTSETVGSMAETESTGIFSSLGSGSYLISGGVILLSICCIIIAIIIFSFAL